MTLRILCAAALAAAALVAPPALADDGSAYYAGGCGWTAIAPAAPPLFGEQPATFMAHVYLAIAFAPGPDGRLVEADVSCELRDHGTERVATLGPLPVEGAGVASGVLTYTADKDSKVELCDVITYRDGSPPVEDCPITLPFCDTFCQLQELAEPYSQWADAQRCALLGAQAPGVPGAVDVTPEGDVHVGGAWVVDCAPFGPYETPVTADSSVVYNDCWDSGARGGLPLTLDEDDGRYVGHLTMATVLTSASRGVAEAVVTCTLRVEGVVHATLGPLPVRGAGTASALVRYPMLEPDQEVSTCMTIEFTDGSPPYEWCSAAVSLCLLLACDVQDLVESTVRTVEGEACTRLGALAPGVPGAATITPEGDVHVGAVWTVDCPPYGPY